MATATNEFRLKLLPSTAYNFSVDWGDGSVEIFNQTTSATENLAGITHAYSTPGIYTVSVSENTPGGFPRIYYNGNTDTSSNNDDVKITGITQWGTIKWTSFADAFEGCGNLTSVINDTGSYLSGSNSFWRAFSSCSKMQNYPSFVNTYNSTNFATCFNGNVALRTIASLDTSKSTNFGSMFQSCTALDYIPLMDTSKVTNFGYFMFDCQNLSYLPSINTSLGSDFTYSWYNCKNLKSFPAINTAGTSSLVGTWWGCSSLTAFPFINTSNVTNFSNTWDSCTGFTNNGGVGYEFPLIDMSKMSIGTNCFANVKIHTTVYDAMLNNLSTNNTNINVTFHAGNSKYSTSAATARSNLVSRGWSITDGGPA